MGKVRDAPCPIGFAQQHAQDTSRFGRYKQKDAYDIYYCVRNYPGGPEVLAEECKVVMAHASGEAGYRFIDAKFTTVDDFGPTCVRQFVQASQILGDRTPEQWQRDAFGQVDAWLRGLGLRIEVLE